MIILLFNCEVYKTPENSNVVGEGDDIKCLVLSLSESF